MHLFKYTCRFFDFVQISHKRMMKLKNKIPQGLPIFPVKYFFPRD